MDSSLSSALLAEAQAGGGTDADFDEEAWVAPPHFTPSSALHSGLRDLEKSLRCNICRELYRIPVSITPCLHSFCSECIRRCLKSGMNGLKRKACCPECREEVGSGGHHFGGDYEKCILPNRGLENAVRKFEAVRGGLKGSLVRLSVLEKQAAEEGYGEGGPKKPEAKRKRGRPRKAATAPAKGRAAGGKRPRRSGSAAAKTGGAGSDSSDDDSDFEDIRGAGDNYDDDDESYSGEEKKSDDPTALASFSPPVAIAPVVASSSVAGPPPRRLKKRAPPMYHGLKKKKLVELLRADGLSTKGTDKILKDRHAEFITLYNAECDSEYPRSAAELAAEIGRREKAKKEEQSKSFATGAASHTAHMERLKQSRKAAGEAGATGAAPVRSGNAAFDSGMSEGFRTLIADAKRRGIAAKKKKKAGGDSGDDVANAGARRVHGASGGGGGAKSSVADGGKVDGAAGTPTAMGAEASSAVVAGTPASRAQLSPRLPNGGGERARQPVPSIRDATGTISSVSSPHAAQSRPPRNAARHSNAFPSVGAPAPVARGVIPAATSGAARSSSGNARGRGRPRQASSPSRSSLESWNCKSCTYLNKTPSWSRAAARCEMCQEPRPPAAGVPAAAAGTRSPAGNEPIEIMDF